MCLRNGCAVAAGTIGLTDIVVFAGVALLGATAADDDVLLAARAC